MTLPIYDLKIIEDAGQEMVWDALRKKFLVLTPEEFVRQNLVLFLIGELGVPRSLIRIEGGLSFNRMKKRSDVVIYDRNGKPMLVAECKRPEVQLDKDAIKQLWTYNMTIDAPFLLLTNGKRVIQWQRNQEGQFELCSALIGFPEMNRIATS